MGRPVNRASPLRLSPQGFVLISWPSLIFPNLASDRRSSFTAYYYHPNGRVGACGAPVQDTDFTVALSADEYASGANGWRHIRVNLNYPGRFVGATVVDLCYDCNSGNIELSPSAFQQFASLDADVGLGTDWLELRVILTLSLAIIYDMYHPAVNE
ncbi:hypothetical protein C8T65DRAFT_597685 [Cerioporus squamosus]|nr:hypothetical protein C8T65DRAFT_597685 [Cerioporus squamosus]